MNAALRTFVALPIDPSIKEILRIVQNDLRHSGADVGWVKPQNLHITLKFLGEIAEKDIPWIVNSLAEIARSTPPYSLQLDHLGTFPKIEHPNIIWVGYSKGANETIQLVEHIKRLLGPLDVRKENRIFHPHVTLGRVRSGKRIHSLTHLLRDYKIEPAIQNVKGMTFFKSTLSASGPVYDVLEEFPFQ